MKTLIIRLIDDNHTNAPLYFKYNGARKAQPCYLYYTPGDVHLVAEYEIDNDGIIPTSVFNGRRFRFHLNSMISRKALVQLSWDLHLIELLHHLDIVLKEKEHAELVHDTEDEIDQYLMTIIGQD